MHVALGNYMTRIVLVSLYINHRDFKILNILCLLIY